MMVAGYCGGYEKQNGPHSFVPSGDRDFNQIFGAEIFTLAVAAEAPPAFSL
jgi:hypothetical protein